MTFESFGFGQVQIELDGIRKFNTLENLYLFHLKIYRFRFVFL